MLAAKVKALLDGRFAVSADDLRAMVLPVLRHRLVINFQGQAEGVTTDRVLTELLSAIKPAHGVG
jgi:MoxR-like ATPase